MASRTDDYTKYRTVDPENPPYQIDDIIGRRDKTDRIATTAMIVSPTFAKVPSYPLGRRNYLMVTNTGAAAVYLTSSGVTTVSGVLIADDAVTANGYKVAAGVTFEDYTDAVFYISTVSGTSTANIYERATWE